ncbi:DUF6314 family protein [Actinoalloteichus hymeniacidonis]|uniref:DUF6314 domain-containing protein n=1 Tax=Actinoalloteichus hymeniacidonis TaxID=340345 RepID=A0AAC9HRA0_9PSEU|nr:DUF6314 family protein [Actinoalloteichus hymeniacidonis]AOS63516.1 hypothetical protein TL08_13510 [Actinoalloteichus hymeniacidonis]MBB5908440.1 hypothetical protein [Actinoalloteichus hymeniacidonis]
MDGHDDRAVHDLGAFLLGRWRLDRRIVDDRGDLLGTVVGSVVITEVAAEVATPPPRSLDYHEEGELVLASYRGPMSRRLEYRLGEAGRAVVHFDHGGFFHDVDLRSGHWQARHPCGDDRYLGTYSVLGPDRWRQEWQVEGPSKAHTIHSEFHRVG